MTAERAGRRLADDRVRPEARALAIFIIPFLVFAVANLYLMPDRTNDYWSWPIKATMTSMSLAAAYFAGIFFFGKVVFAQHWHQVKLGFLPVTTFATMLGIATIIHWDKFFHDRLAFVLWVGLYFTAPFLVFGVWLRNRGADPGSPDPDDLTVPPIARALVGSFGAVLLAIALILFLVPDVGVASWPWSLTPLTARVVGAIFALPAVAGLGIAFDGRWSSARVVFESLGLSFLLVLIATARARNEFNPSSATTYVFIISMVILFTGSIVIYARLESRRRSAAVPKPAPSGPST